VWVVAGFDQVVLVTRKEGDGQVAVLWEAKTHGISAP